MVLFFLETWIYGLYYFYKDSCCIQLLDEKKQNLIFINKILRIERCYLNVCLMDFVLVPEFPNKKGLLKIVLRYC